MIYLKKKKKKKGMVGRGGKRWEEVGRGGKRWEEVGRWRSSSRRPTGFATHVFIKKLQMDKLVEEADC
jgi:hypothetical protein